jgi:hypothetical protein
MGVFMKEDDTYIASMLDLLNLRFGPTQGIGEYFGGIEEMVELQKEFKVFKPGRSFRDSAAVLNLGGFWNARAKNRWLLLLERLAEVGSNINGKNGSDAIVSALIDNLAAEKRLPVHFKAHEAGPKAEASVLIGLEKRPIFYDYQDYLTVSLPMTAWDRAAAKGKGHT